jgi:hypothetical protein
MFPSEPAAPSPTPHRSIPGMVAALALTGLALLAMGMIVRNLYVQDDSGIIRNNLSLHQWSAIWRAFTIPYWPPVTSHELYRPLSSGWYAVQWMVGGGDALLFRLTSLALYVGSILAVWGLLRDLLPAPAAWIGAALFAVHPVHVESVALAVNQSELIVATLLAIAIRWRIRANRDPGLTSRAKIGIWALFTLALFVKEHALVLPGLLLATDLMVDQGAGWPTERLRRWRFHYVALIASAVAFWWLRGRILGGGSGTGPAEALDGADLLHRAYTMLGMPAEWLRLFVWPARLQSDWNLLEWVPTRGWSLRETAGVCALVAFVASCAAAWRRRPVAAFGLAWMVVALAPVSNVLIPSGIILAERTLYLASIGFTIVVADLAALALPRWGALAPLGRRLGLTALGVLLAAGALRSAVRTGDWRTRWMYLTSQMLDAPTSWRARFAYAMLLADVGDTTQARTEVERTIALRPDLPLAAKILTDRIRLDRGSCAGPVIAYDEMLAVAPGRSDVRGSLVACLLYLGRYAEARIQAEGGVALDLDADYFRYVIGVADSASLARAAPQTVRLRPIGKEATVIGLGSPEPR